MTKLLNLSGHQNAALESLGFTFPGTVQVDPTAALSETAGKYAAWLAGLGVGSGDAITCVLPGMSTLAGMAMSAIHGLTGTFPMIVSLVRQPDGSFTPSEGLDLQEYRNTVARSLRPGLVQL